MDQKTDETLVGEALVGQREAFDALVRRYQDCAYGVAIGRLGDFDLARDVVQEAFLCAYRDLPKLREPRRFAAWLNGIVRRMAALAARELARVQGIAAELTASVELVARETSPGRQAEDAERHTLVRDALARMSGKNREAVSLYYVDGLSYAEIAGFLGVAVTTVQGRLQRGRAELRRDLSMVAETLKEKHLPEDFAEQIKRLLDSATERGQRHEQAIHRLAKFGRAAVDPLCDALNDSRAMVRRAAACALCNIGDARSLRPLLRTLYSKEDPWSPNALLRSGRALNVPGFREELLRMLDDERQRYWALLALAHAKDDEEIYQRLLCAFRQPQFRDRPSAFVAMVRMRPEKGAEICEEALRDPHLRRHGIVSWVTWHRGHLPPLEVLVSAARGQPDWHGRVAIGLLVLKHGEQGHKALEELLQSNLHEVRVTAAAALAQSGDPRAFPPLFHELRCRLGPKKWRRHVSFALARNYPQEMLEWIEREGLALGNADEVLWSLARGRPEAMTAVAEKVLRTGRPAVRAAAVRNLARRKGAAFIPELRRLLRDGKPRKAAQEAFWQLYRLGDAAMPAVEEMLESDSWQERKAAVCLLRRSGKLTNERRTRAEQDDHVAVRQAAGWHPN